MFSENIEMALGEQMGWNQQVRHNGQVHRHSVQQGNVSQPIKCHMSLSATPKNIRKTLIFYFQGVKIWNGLRFSGGKERDQWYENIFIKKIYKHLMNV